MGFIDTIKGYFVQENTVVKYHETQISTAFASTYDAIGVIARCVDLIVNTAAEIEYKIVEDVGPFNVLAKHDRFETLLENPSDEFGRIDFYRTCFKDEVFSGNSFLYNLGNELQLLEDVSYDSTKRPKSGTQNLDEDRLIHTRLLQEKGSRFGKSYLTRIDKELDLIAEMLTFQKNLFKNGAVPGVILSSESPLSKKQKERIAEEFLAMYSIMRGNSSKPFVADNALDVKSMSHSFKELEFNEGVQNISDRICAALGVPQVLLTSGNQANLIPNYKLFVYNTIAPFVNNFASDLTLHLHKFYRGTKKLKVVPNFEVLALLKDDQLKETTSIKGLVTSGVITPNEARAKLHYLKHIDPLADDLLFPANITGALNEPSSGVPNEEE